MKVFSGMKSVGSVFQQFEWVCRASTTLFHYFSTNLVQKTVDSVQPNRRIVHLCNISHLWNVLNAIWLMLCANNHLKCILSINYAVNMLAHTVDVTDVDYVVVVVIVVWINESCCPMSSTGWLIAIIQANNTGRIVPCHRNSHQHSRNNSRKILTPAIR